MLIYHVNGQQHTCNPSFVVFCWSNLNSDTYIYIFIYLFKSCFPQYLLEIRSFVNCGWNPHFSLAKITEFWLVKSPPTRLRLSSPGPPPLRRAMRLSGWVNRLRRRRWQKARGSAGCGALVLERCHKKEETDDKIWINMIAILLFDKVDYASLYVSDMIYL